jgi:cell division transport system permease protein
MSSVSGIDGSIGEPNAGGPAAAERRPPARLPRIKLSPLFPESGSGGAPLTAVLAVISSLACFALAAFILIADAARDWTSDLNASVTVQVKGETPQEIDERVAAALAALKTAEIVAEARPVSRADAEKLLEPWLGAGNLEGLNIPALIDLKLREGGRARIDELRALLASAAPGLSLDDHGDWNRRLATAARSGQALAFSVFVLIMAAACAISMFAARAGLAANHEVVSLLHLVGATDDFIARQVQRRFTLIGLRGALIGLGVALFGLFLVALGARARGATGLLMPGLTINWDIVAPLMLVPIAVCLATAVSARLTVLRTLRETY